MKLPLEKEIQANIVTLLETVGAAVYKIGTKRKKGDHQGTMQTAGIPDLVRVRECSALTITVSPHRDVILVQLWIEVKRPGEDMSDAASWRFNGTHALNSGCEHVSRRRLRGRWHG